MFCTNCGKENRDDAKFCVRCGTKLIQTETEKNILPEDRKPAEDRKTLENVKRPVQTSSAQRAGKHTGKLILIILAVILILAAAVTTMILTVLSKRKTGQYEKIMAQAERCLEESDYENAEAGYLSAIEISPEKEEPYLKLAEIYNVQDEPEKAVTILEQGLTETKSSQVEQKYNLYSYVDSVLIPEEGECQEGEYTCSYIRTSDYVELEPVHSQKGVVNSRIRDFDNDGQEELLVLIMNNDAETDNYTGSNQNAVSLRMYETEGTEVVLKDEFTELAPVLGRGDYENCGLFLQENGGNTYICGGIYQLLYMYADGAAYNSFVLTYSDGRFIQQAGTDGILAGSEFSGERNNAYEMAEYLDSINLPNEAARIRERWVRCFSYIDDCEEMLMLITGENDGTGSALSYSRSKDPSDLGKVNLTLKTHWENGEQIKVIEEPALDTGGNEEENTQENAGVSAETYTNVYGAILDQGYADSTAGTLPFYLYSVYDIDKDGVKELLILAGTCEADYMYQVYTIENGTGKFLGEIPGGHSGLCADEEGGTQPYIIRLQAHMGYEVISHISIRDGALVSETVSEREVPADGEYYSNNYPLETADPADRSLLEKE